MPADESLEGRAEDLAMVVIEEVMEDVPEAVGAHAGNHNSRSASVHREERVGPPAGLSEISAGVRAETEEYWHRSGRRRSQSLREPSDGNLPPRLVPVSKTLSRLLRYRATDYGLLVRSDGFIPLCCIMDLRKDFPHRLKDFRGTTERDFEEVVQFSLKRGRHARFDIIEEDGTKFIRVRDKCNLPEVDLDQMPTPRPRRRDERDSSPPRAPSRSRAASEASRLVERHNMRTSTRRCPADCHGIACGCREKRRQESQMSGGAAQTPPPPPPGPPPGFEGRPQQGETPPGPPPGLPPALHQQQQQQDEVRSQPVIEAESCPPAPQATGAEAVLSEPPQQQSEHNRSAPKPVAKPKPKIPPLQASTPQAEKPAARSMEGSPWDNCKLPFQDKIGMFEADQGRGSSSTAAPPAKPTESQGNAQNVGGNVQNAAWKWNDVDAPEPPEARPLTSAVPSPPGVEVHSIATPREVPDDPFLSDDPWKKGYPSLGAQERERKERELQEQNQRLAACIPGWVERDKEKAARAAAGIQEEQQLQQQHGQPEAPRMSEQPECDQPLEQQPGQLQPPQEQLQQPGQPQPLQRSEQQQPLQQEQPLQQTLQQPGQQQGQPEPPRMSEQPECEQPVEQQPGQPQQLQEPQGERVSHSVRIEHVGAAATGDFGYLVAFSKHFPAAGRAWLFFDSVFAAGQEVTAPYHINGMRVDESSTQFFVSEGDIVQIQYVGTRDDEIGWFYCIVQGRGHGWLPCGDFLRRGSSWPLVREVQFQDDLEVPDGMIPNEVRA